MKIALLCPTRERPKDVKRLIDSLENTMASDENFALYLGVDDDDPTRFEVAKFAKKWFVHIIPIKNDGKFLGLGKIWNIMASGVEEDILAMIGDDMIFETKEWDNLVLDEFKKINDGVLLVHVNDGMRGAGNPFPNETPLAVNSFLHRRYYDIFGYYVREEWKHGFHDTWLHDVYNKTNGRRIYRHDIMINHLHVSNPNADAKVDAVTNTLNKAYVEVKNPQQSYDNLAPLRKREGFILKEITELFGGGKRG